jgi:serine/threonine protein kinase/tetratricopeptide (TPR) repeat protein
MKNDEWNLVWAVFEEALALDDLAAKRALVAGRCGLNVRMEQEVLSLIEAHEKTSILDAPERVFVLPDVGAGEHVGPYRILDEIGRGGMGVVYRARDERLDRTVALKMLPRHLVEDLEAKARLTAEARAAARLEHANIATIYDIGEAPDGRVYFAMAFYSGETLEERIRRGPLEVEDALDILSQVAEGVDRAHGAGIVHRDIKPANILITSDGVAKILDFGIAKISDVGRTISGVKIGTVAYMSPEQARGRTVDHRSDLWSLGVLVYEMLTGRRPFEGDQDDAVLYAIVHEPAAPPSSLQRGLSPGIDHALEKALQKKPPDRYQSAQEIAEALAEAGRAPLPHSFPPDEPRLSSTPERVRATVLVSQVLGYVQLVDHVVPEELQALGASIRSRAAGVIDRCGGMLYEMDGESLVALFGIPNVHEDDFVRAVRAARELHAAVRELSEECRRRTGCTLGLATGIDTGSVVAQPQDASLRVTGEPMLIARQLSHRAEPEEILVSPECGRLVRPFFETKLAESARIKGSNRTLTPYRVLRETGSETRIEAAQSAGLTDYSGRDRELRLLVEAHEQALEGRGRMIAVLGEAGMGKSRLLFEFRDRVDRGTRILRGRCVPHGGKIPYLPFSGVLREHLNLSEDRIEENVVVERVRAVDESLEIFLPYYLHLLSVESERYRLVDHQNGEDMRMAMIEALSGVLTLSARQQPLVLLLEDWHWSDEASREVLTQLAELAPAYAMLVLVTFRPEYDGEWLPQNAAIHLTPLDLEPTTAMMRSVIGAREVPEELVRLIHQRTGGNPFFLEEVCSALLEEGVLGVESGRAVIRRSFDTLELPDTVQAVIRARLHRLGPEGRRILRVASVSGREFSRRLIESALPAVTNLTEQLEELGELGLIQKIAVLPEVAYRFKHVLTQEVVYDTLLHHQRKALHAEIGESLEMLMAERIDEHLDMFVHHFSRAEDWLKAARYGRQAARRAMRLGQFPEASIILKDAVDWLRKLPDDAGRRDDYIDALLELERVCETTGDRSRQQDILEELLARLQPGGDPALLAEVFRRRGDLDVLRRRLAEADRSLASALELATASGDDDVFRRILRSLGFLRWNEGRSEEAIALNKEVLRLHRASGDDRAVIGDLVNLCIIARDDGRFDEAMGYLEEAQDVLEHEENPSVDAYIYHSIGILHHLIGDTERALEFLNKAAAMAEAHRLPLQHSFDLMSMANIYLGQGEIDRSIEFYKQAIDLTRRSRYADGLAKTLRVFGQVLLSLERFDEALPYLDESVEWFRKLEDRPSEAEVLTRLADLHEEREQLDDAVQAWERVAELLEDLDPRYEIDTVEAFARLARKRGSEAESLSYYHDAIDLAHRAGDPSREARLRNAAGILSWRRGCHDDALAHYEKALPLLEGAGDDAGTGLMLNSMAACLLKLDRPAEAALLLERALAVHRRSGKRQLEAHALALLGDAFRAVDEPERALQAYSASLQLRWDLEDRAGEGWMLLRMAETHRARGETERARDYAGQSRLIAEELGDEKMTHSSAEIQH